MAEEEVVCINCGGEVRTDIKQPAEGVYWCDGCDHFVPVVPKAKPVSPCHFCRGTGDSRNAPGVHDVDEFYKEDPPPMKCPNCGGELKEDQDGIVPRLYHRLDLGLLRVHGDATSAYESDLVHTIHKCSHCHSIVLRCEE